MDESWATRPLGKIADLTMGQSPPGSTYNTERDGTPFLQGSAEFGDSSPHPVKWCSAPTRIAEPGDLLFSVRAPVGDLNWADQKLAIGRGLAIVRGTDQALVQYIALALRAAVGSIRSSAKGGMFTSITKSGLQSIPIPVAPLSEQRRIVDLMRSVDEVVAASRQYLLAVERLYTSVIGNLASRGEQVTIGDIAKCVGGYAFPTRFQGSVDGEFPFFKVSDMNADGNERTLEHAANRVTSEQLSAMRGKTRPEGTVVFPKVGAALKTEKRRLLGVEGCFDNNIMGLAPDEASVSPEYLLVLMECVALSDHVQEGAVPSVNNRIVGGIPVRVPSLEDQVDSLNLVTALTDCRESARVRCAASEALSGSLLRRLLSGELRVKSTYDRFLGATVS